MAVCASRWYDVDPHVIETFVGQRVDFALGSIYLISSFALAVKVHFIPNKWLSAGLPTYTRLVAFALMIALLATTLAFRAPITNANVKRIKAIAERTD